MHDKFGHALKPGDDVLIHAKVTECHEGDNYCNVTLETEEVMFPGDAKSTVNLNAKQVMKAKKGKGPGGVTILGETLGPGDVPPPPPPDPGQGG